MISKLLYIYLWNVGRQINIFGTVLPLGQLDSHLWGAILDRKESIWMNYFKLALPRAQSSPVRTLLLLVTFDTY